MSSMTITGTVIAKGAPNRCQDGRTVMCAIVVSDELGLIRLYPLSVSKESDIRIWSRVRCEIVKRNTDCRLESFRVISSVIIDRVEDPTAKADLMNSCILRSGSDDPLRYQDANHRSIAIVKPGTNVGAALECRDTDAVDHSIDTEDAWVMCQSEYPFKPYLIWQSVQGGNHKSHLCAQEVYEGMRHNAATPFRIFENLHIGDPDYDHWLVMGNMKDRRTVWVCAHLHRQKKTSSNTATNLLMFDGPNENWPYSQQEAINARTAEPQKTFSFTT
jgi:hypothetical protein